MGTILLSILGVALAMLMMAVGAIVSNRCLRGSCGGRDVLGLEGEPLTCDTCPLRDTPQSDARTAPRRSPGSA